MGAAKMIALIFEMVFVLRICSDLHAANRIRQSSFTVMLMSVMRGVRMLHR
jgi:hypothetical protein